MWPHTVHTVLSFCQLSMIVYTCVFIQKHLFLLISQVFTEKRTFLGPDAIYFGWKVLVKPGSSVVILPWRKTCRKSPLISVSARSQPNHYINLSYSRPNSGGSISNSEGTREFSDQFSQQELSFNTWGVYNWVCVSNRNTFEGKGTPTPQHFQHSLPPLHDRYENL